MNFSKPYFEAGQVVVVKKDNDAIKTKDDLAARRPAPDRHHRRDRDWQYPRREVEDLRLL